MSAPLDYTIAPNVRSPSFILQRECLKWAADGLTAAEIATQLSRSLAVVTLHLASAMHKLGAKNRVQAVVRATHYRLLED